MFSSPAGVAASGVAFSVNIWCSQILIVCATPSSVIVKSFAVNPSMGFPFLSFTPTASIISRNVTLIVAAWSAVPTGLFCPVNCAPAGRLPVPAATNTTHAARVNRIGIEKVIRILQYLSRIVICICRIVLAGSGAPNCGLPTVVFQPEYTTWLSTFVASIWVDKFNRLLSRNVRCISAFRLNWFGPVIESRRAVPHWPAAGA